MVHMLSTSNQNEISPFIKYNEWRSYYGKAIDHVLAPETLGSWAVIDTLVDGNILPVYSGGGDKFFLKGDLDDISSILIGHYGKHLSQELIEGQCEVIGKLAPLILNQKTVVSLTERVNAADFAYYSAIRNLIVFCRTMEDDDQISFEEIPYFSATTISSLSKEVSDFVAHQSQRAKKVSQSKAGLFAHSAYYMGSKRNLGAFLIEAISRFLPRDDGVIIDLMCGSGGASQAFSTIWPTYSSDAQFFCRHLALIQGRGYTYRRANNILRKILPSARKNINELNEYFRKWIKKEDIFFHSNINEKLFEDYKEFIEETSCYPTYKTSTGEQLYKEVVKRKKTPTLTPYCLFSAYFANIYFGLRQSVEIDSICYAINQLENSTDRDWAMGALIATISYLGSTYAAHFAQPKKLTLKNLPVLVDQRAKSVIHEFSIRFVALARESEYANHPIKILSGPWQKALSAAEKIIQGKKVLVYLDAPYKREEYSRYYHVLETAVLYNYPSATKKGKLPDKKKGERFLSVFFSRNRNKIEEELLQIICSILERGWICAWSYSDNGDASIMNVIELVYNKKNCRVVSFSTPYRHKSQGKRKQKTVTEYYILFLPEEK